MVNNRNMRYYAGNNGNASNNNNMNNLNGSCGCGDSCDALKKKLCEIDFAIAETVLYLDAYPECKTALDYYCKLKEERRAVADAVNEKCGPITAMNNGCVSWDWVKTPWPWEYGAN